MMTTYPVMAGMMCRRMVPHDNMMLHRSMMPHRNMMLHRSMMPHNGCVVRNRSRSWTR
jgi:hypothetical protein